MTRITVVGSLNMDLVIRVPRIPEPGQTIIGGTFDTVPGGKGANQAVAAARLGAQVSMIGQVGHDAFGETLLESLSANDVDHSFVKQDTGAATGVAFITVDEVGNNGIVVAPGANMQLSPADVDSAENTIAASNVILLQLESPLETVRRAAEISHAHGVKVILNLAPARSLPKDLLSLVDVLIPNESETAFLIRRLVSEQVEAEAAAIALVNAGVRSVILTLGDRGALLAQAGRTTYFPAFDVTPVDTTAAGDAFGGGFGVALAGGKPIAEAVRWGNAAGALATTQFGAQPSLPTRQALKNMLNSF